MEEQGSTTASYASVSRWDALLAASRCSAPRARGAWRRLRRPPVLAGHLDPRPRPLVLHWVARCCEAHPARSMAPPTLLLCSAAPAARSGEAYPTLVAGPVEHRASEQAQRYVCISRLLLSGNGCGGRHPHLALLASFLPLLFWLGSPGLIPLLRGGSCSAPCAEEEHRLPRMAAIVTLAWRRYLDELHERPLRTKVRQEHRSWGVSVSGARQGSSGRAVAGRAPGGAPASPPPRQPGCSRGAPGAAPSRPLRRPAPPRCSPRSQT